MQRYRKIIILVIAILVTATTLLVIKGQQQEVASSNKEETLDEKVAQLPVTDFIVEEPKDPEQRSLRQARNSRRNSSVITEGIRPPVLNESMEPILLDLPLSDQPEAPAIPVSESDVIVIGKAVEAKAYISSDRTNVYSEVAVTIEEVLKGDPRLPLIPEATLYAERSGGAVRFPSGKILRRGSLGKNIPRPGDRYLLFLSYNDEGKDFSIITGYELSGNHVFPLDGTGRKGAKFSQFSSYEKHRGKEELIFLNEVRTAISQERGSRKGGK